MHVYDTASHQVVLSVMQYQPFDELSSDQQNTVFLDGDFNDSSYERAFIPYKNSSPTDTFESDWYGDVDDCSNDDSSPTQQSRQQKNRSYNNVRGQPSPQKTKSALMTKPLTHRKSVNLKKPPQRLEEHNLERAPKCISDSKHVIRSLQMQLRKAMDSIQICSLENKILQKQLKSSIESTDINHFNDSDVGQSKSTNVSKFRGTTASQQITIENLQIEKKHLQAALSKQSASSAVPQSKEFSIYDIKDNSTARSSISEASYDNVPLCDRSQIGLEAQVEKLRELLSRGKENQDTLLDDLNRSKRLNKHLRSTIKCLEKSSAEAEAEKKAIQNKYQKQLLTVKRNTSRRATSTGLTPRDQVVKKRGEENGTRQGDSDKDKVVVPCLTTSGRKASSAEHSATITEPKIESSRLTEHVEIPTQLVPDTRSSRDITEEEKNQILALKLSPSGLSENVVNKGIDEDQDQDQDHDYDPDQREDIFAITEGPCKSCTLYVNSLQQKLQRQKRIHEREIRGLRSVSASPMNSARSEKNGHFFPSVPTTPAASYRCDRRTTGFTLGAVDVPAVTVVPISTVVTSAMCLTSNATSADDVTTSTANNCSLKENVVNFDDHRVGISTSTSIATEQIIGADNLTSSFLSQPTDSTTTKVATDMIAAAVNTAKGRVTFAVSVAASPPPQTPRRTSLRPARLTLSPQIPTSPKGSKPSNGSSSRVIKLKEEVIEPI